MKIILIGYMGSGKTTIGKRLSKILEMPFYDADDYHNDKSIKKMKEELPLDDADRVSWLSLLSLRIRRWNLHGDAILACSALKRKYRYKLSNNNKVTFIFLDGKYDLIYKRLLERKNHFFTVPMLKSQFTTLEVPVNCIRISIDKSESDICLSIVNNIQKEVDAK